MGISVDEAAFHTSALATAEFLGRQKPGGTAYVIGGRG
jgi:NagD protein